SEHRKLAVLMRMALTYADAAGAEPDAVKRLDLCMTCWRQASVLSPSWCTPSRAAGQRTNQVDVVLNLWTSKVSSYSCERPIRWHEPVCQASFEVCVSPWTSDVLHRWATHRRTCHFL